MKFRTNSPAQTQQLATDFIKALTQNVSAATIVCLYGDLGAGKTTFTQFVAEALGVTETVTSPTFVIEKIYKLENKAFSHLIHIDAYRLERADELETLGWHEITSEPGNLILIEWPEKVDDIIPDVVQKIFFTFIDENTREIDIRE